MLGDWNAKVGSQEIPGVTGICGLGVQNKAGRRLTEFVKRTCWSLQTSFSNNPRDSSTSGHYQMVCTKDRLIMFFAAEHGEFSQQKEDLELTMVQTMNSLLQNSGLN